MAAGNSNELGRLIYRYGGEAVGSFMQPIGRPIQSSIAHAIFLDQSHDNPSPVEKRSIYDLLPSSALIAMSASATGSNRGYDELVPHHIHVVNESRLYATWSELSTDEDNALEYGILKAKRALNQLHFELTCAGYTQVNPSNFSFITRSICNFVLRQIYVDQMNSEVVAVTRHNPTTHQSVVLVAHTAFGKPAEGAVQGHIRNLVVEGSVQEVILEAHLSHVKALYVFVVLGSTTIFDISISCIEMFFF